MKGGIKIKNGKIQTLKVSSFTSQGNKRKTLDYDCLPRPKRAKLVHFDQYEDAMCKVLATYRMTDKADDYIYILRHFKISMIETKAFLKYYLIHQANKGDMLMLPIDFFEATVCMEMIFRQSIKFYGPNEISRCKDCEFMDKSSTKIMHPL